MDECVKIRKSDVKLTRAQKRQAQREYLDFVQNIEQLEIAFCSNLFDERYKPIN